jgi:hypothetical protein
MRRRNWGDNERDQGFRGTGIYLLNALPIMKKNNIGILTIEILK